MLTPLASALAESARTLGLGEVAAELASEIDTVVTPRLDEFRRHPNWPTRLTAHRAPFEFSVSIGPSGRGVRYTLDATDYRRDLARNWQDYIDVAQALVRVDCDRSPRLHGILAEHLHGCPADLRLRMVHGAGYGSGGRRATLYFSANWLGPSEFLSRFPGPAAAVAAACRRAGLPSPKEYGAIARDFVTGHADIVRTKVYVWPDGVEDAVRLRELVGEHPDLDLAHAIYTKFRPLTGTAPRSLVWTLAYSADPGEARQKVEFLCPVWGWHVPGGLAELLAFLGDATQTDLWPLQAVLSACAEHDVRVAPTVVAAGPGTDVTFYFVPVDDEATAKRVRTRRGETSDGLAAALRSGIEYLLSTRAVDGHWHAEPATEHGGAERCGSMCVWTTASVTAVLARDETARDCLAASLAWLEANAPADPGREHLGLEAAGLRLLAGLRGGASTGEDARALAAALSGRASLDRGDRMFDGALSTEAMAAGAAALLLAGDEAGPALVRALLDRQRTDGGWDGAATDAMITSARAVEALADAMRSEMVSAHPDLFEAVGASAREARAFATGRATPAEPLLLGSWLACWFGTGGDISHPSVGRVVRAVVAAQQRDGRWLSTPARYTSARRLHADVSCAATSAAVVEGLLAAHALPLVGAGRGRSWPRGGP